MVRRSCSILLCLVALCLAGAGWPLPVRAQVDEKPDPYAEPVPDAAGGAVLPDADHPADPAGNTFYSYIECLSNRWAVNGLFNWVDDSHDNEFRPGEPITRAQAIKAIVRAMGWPLLYPTTPTFTDVPRSSPYYRHIGRWRST